jgi:hypothetical protein
VGVFGEIIGADEYIDHLITIARPFARLCGGQDP